jgi:hypothetical protein
VKIDKDFFWHLMRKRVRPPADGCAGDLFINNHHNVIIEGVESEAIKNGCREWRALLNKSDFG